MRAIESGRQALRHAAVGIVRDKPAPAHTVQATMLPDGIGYLAIRGFAPFPGAARQLAEALDRVARSEALIVDFRGNTGGDPATAALFASLFFDTESAHLEETYRPMSEHGVQSAKTSVRYLDRPVIVVVDGQSSLLAWRCATNLRTLGRAVTAGELPSISHGEIGAELDVPSPAATRRSRFAAALALPGRLHFRPADAVLKWRVGCGAA